MESLRKNMQFEIDRLTAALADCEARMKVWSIALGRYSDTFFLIQFHFRRRSPD